MTRSSYCLAVIVLLSGTTLADEEGPPTDVIAGTYTGYSFSFEPLPNPIPHPATLIFRQNGEFEGTPLFGILGLLEVGPVLPGSTWEAFGSFILANFAASGPGFENHATAFEIEGIVMFNLVVLYQTETYFSIFRVLEYGVAFRQF